MVGVTDLDADAVLALAGDGCRGDDSRLCSQCPLTASWFASRGRWSGPGPATTGCSRRRFARSRSHHDRPKAIGGGGGALLALVAACASTAERRPTAPRVEPSALDGTSWDAATGRLGCAGGYADLTLDPELRERVRVITPGIWWSSVLPQVNSALMVTVSPSSLRGKRAGVLGDLPEIGRSYIGKRPAWTCARATFRAPFARRAAGSSRSTRPSRHARHLEAPACSTSSRRSLQPSASPSMRRARRNGGWSTARLSGAGSRRSIAWRPAPAAPYPAARRAARRARAHHEMRQGAQGPEIAGRRGRALSAKARLFFLSARRVPAGVDNCSAGGRRRRL